MGPGSYQGLLHPAPTILPLPLGAFRVLFIPPFFSEEDCSVGPAVVTLPTALQAAASALSADAVVVVV